MRILGFEITRASSPGPRPAALSPEGLSAEVRNLLLGTGPYALNSPEQALKVAAVYRCVTLISGAVATMPIAVKRRIGEARVDASDHQLWTLLRKRPNPWQTPSQFKRQLQTHLLLRGRGLAMKVRAGPRIVGLIPLAPDRVVVTQGDDWKLRYDYTTRTGARVALAHDDVFHLVGHTLDGINGLSPLGCARETIGLAIEMRRHARQTFANGAKMTGVITAPAGANLDAEAIERIRESIDAYRHGGQLEGKELLLEEGLTYERMGLTMEDAQFVESGAANRSEIYMFFGVPPHMAGDTTKTTSWGSGIEQQSLGFVAYTLEDWLTTWEESIARDLIPDNEPNLFARFNRAALVRGDIKTRYAAYAVARQWGLQTPDEIRALEELAPLPGGLGSDPFAGGNGQRASAAADDDAVVPERMLADED